MREAPIERLAAQAFEIPTDQPESDGTAEWRSTTLVVVEARAGGRTGLGYTYADRAVLPLVTGKLAPAVAGREALDIPAAWSAMRQAVRNLGETGLTAMALSAVDVALWDLKGKLLGVSVVRLLGAERARVPLYGSGGFTSYSVDRLREQLGGWAGEGFARVKMKVGRDPAADRERVRAAREAIGARTALFVDANGAYRRKQALELASAFAAQGVSWFEEPVTSDDLPGLGLIRDRAPEGMEIAAGEYGFALPGLSRLLEVVDVLQADATRCGGYTGFLRVAALCDAHSLPLSAHTAPALHLPVCCAAPRLAHLEFFHDHARIEEMLFEGARRPQRGELAPDLDRPGIGLELKASDAARYAV
jgi:L-alanine-DL-glutamate epimerase-like enolase superfamily enzyme